MSANGTDVRDIPEGFDDVTPSNEIHWALKEEGAIVQGILVKRVSLKENRALYEVKLTKSCKALNADKETVMLQPGQVVSLDETYDLRCLAEFRYGMVEIYVKFLGKIKLDNGNTKWELKVGKRNLSDGEDIPF